MTEFFKNDIISVDETFVNPFPELEIQSADGAEFKGYNPAEVGDSTNRMYAMMQGLVNGAYRPRDRARGIPQCRRHAEILRAAKRGS
ncbi:hypothetical protein [Nocardia sp. CC227C]|uniref:hypothetical protein n=1 Tax=Nocardia sp. CC227C TaxID=3044562 RepID=UPI00278C2823|nr:hypothetical protein [Nocardia sp. CC227C]